MIDQNIQALKELKQKYQSVVTELNKVITGLESDNLKDYSEFESSIAGDFSFRDLSNTLKRIKFYQTVELSHNRSKAKAMIALDNQNQGGNNNNNGNGRP